MRQKGLTGGRRLARLIERRPPFKKGLWLDAYNQIWNERVCGTLKARTDSNCMYFVTWARET